MLPTGQLSFSFDLPGSFGTRQSAPFGPPSLLSLVRRRLLARHGPQRMTERPDPIYQLLNGIISARTRDEVSMLAFGRLLHRCRSVHVMAHTSPDDMQRLLRGVTFAEKKAEQIPSALRLIEEKSGRLDLMFLDTWPEDPAMAWLMELPGTGPKVAATVLNWSILSKRVLVVDTHLLRVGKRLGLLPDNADYLRGYGIFMRLVPAEWDADDLFEFHWLMKLHSQQVCTYEAPACLRCPLRDLCPRSVIRH